MKKFSSLLLSIVLIISVMLAINTLVVSASETTENTSSSRWEWETYGDGVSLTKYNGDQTDVYVPSTVEKDGVKYDVLKLGDNLFKDNTTLNSATLGEGITEIGASAFEGATNLVCIVTPESLATIGANAFSGCINFNSVILYDAVTSIGIDAFAGCSKVTVYCNERTAAYNYVAANSIKYKILNPDAEPEEYTQNGITYYITNGEAIAISADYDLNDVVIPSMINGYPVTELRSTFKDHPVQSVSLPNTLKIIGPNAFYDAWKLTTVSIQNGVTSIGSYAFHGCYKLKNIALPISLTNIGTNAFVECDGLTDITIPDGVTQIGTYAFYSCDGLTDITIPSSVKIIDSHTFDYCINLTSVTITYGVTSIGEKAFNSCNKLSSVFIPNSVTSISPDSFTEKTILVVEKNSHTYNFAISNDLLYFVQTPTESAPTFYEVDGITYYIMDGNAIAISAISSLTDVVIPEKVNGYDVTALKETFKGCKLQTISLPNTITSIGSNAFYGCYNLTNITIPSSVTKIGEHAFSHSGLLTIVIPDSVTSIGPGAFSICTNLTAVKLSSNLKTISRTAFYYCISITDIEIPAKVTTIEDYAFKDCNRLVSATIPMGVTNISVSAFPCTTVLLVVKNSFAHNFALDNNFLYSDSGTMSICTVDGITYYLLSDRAVAISADETLTDVIIPSKIEGLPVTELIATFNESSVESVSLPNTLKTIGAYTFYNCFNIPSIEIPESVTVIGDRAFAGCANPYEIVLPQGVTHIGEAAFAACFNLKHIIIPAGVTSIKRETFHYCESLTAVTIPENITQIDDYAFANCISLDEINIPKSVTSIGHNTFTDTSITKVKIPKTVSSMQTDSFSPETILMVYEGSYAHTFAVDNDLLYFVIQKTDNPQIDYGSALCGTVSYTNGSPVSGATVEILYDDGTVKETVTTDETGAYEFTYAEVGRYTIRVTDSNSNTASEVVSVKRMNAFDVYMTGETDLVLKKGYTVSGTVSPETATITLTDTDGNIIKEINTTDGEFAFTNISNGTYILKAETENGTAIKEITVFNADIAGEELTVETVSSATITGYVEVEDREFNRHKRIWVEVTIYNEEGIAVDSMKTDADGNYTFTNLPLGEYSIVAETNEMRPDKHKHFDRSHKLTGYAYVDVTEAKTYDNINIVLYEENEHKATISGKITAQGETQDCEVILSNVFKHEIAKYETRKNGKYTFKNIPDGLYFITAITNSDGMGFAVVIVRNGEVYGNTDITIRKSDRVRNYEDRMRNEIPECDTREKALEHKDKIIEHKRFYDSLPEKEKKHFSKDYIRRLNKLAELIADISYDKPDGVEIESGGTVISGDELDSEEKIEFVLSISETSEHEISDDGIKNGKDFEQQSINDAAKDKHIAKYYDISLTKNGKKISNVHKHTDTTGKLRIKMEIPEEYRGHKHYTFVHMHNGEPTTLVDLDDDPNTVTFEVDRFSTFVLTYSDVELTEEEEEIDSVNITYDEEQGMIWVDSPVDGHLYIATYDIKGLVKVERYTISAETADIGYEFNSNQAAFIWDENMVPLCGKFTLGN